MTDETLPLHGVVVLDVSRMLPGAVLARQLIDLGCRLIKVEEPGGGDPLRHAPPLHDGVSAAFAAYLRGAESLCLDLTDDQDAGILRRLARHADVLVESFRPGTMEAWGLSVQRLQATNPGLVWCSLSAYGRRSGATAVAHDLNLVAESGLLSLLGSDSVPRLQLADVTTGLLAASSVLAALLRRQRSGRGSVIEQPLLSGTMPHLTWALADAAGGEGASLLPTVLAGHCPAYRIYRCADDTAVAVGALEPKLWSQLVQVLGLPELAGDGLDLGERGAVAGQGVAAAFSRHPQQHWLSLATEHELPISAVAQIPQATQEGGCLEVAGLLEQTPLEGGGSLVVPGPFLPSLGRAPQRPAPRLGEHSASILREMGMGGQP